MLILFVTNHKRNKFSNAALLKALDALWITSLIRSERNEKRKNEKNCFEIPLMDLRLF